MLVVLDFPSTELVYFLRCGVTCDSSGVLYMYAVLYAHFVYSKGIRIL